MPKRYFNMTTCAILSVVLFVLLILARCHGPNRPAGTPSADGSAPGFPETAPAASSNEADDEPPSVTVLMYHHLLRREENTRYQGNDIVTYTEDFRGQLAWLAENGFTSISLPELEAYLYEGGPLPERPVLITFDDGYLSNAVYGVSLLEEYGFTAVVFSVTGKIGDTPQTFNPAAVQMLDRETMKKSAPVLTFASHTHRLHTATGAGRSALTDGSREAVAADLADSLEALRAFSNHTDRAFSYPYGFSNDKVKEVLREQGIRLAFRAVGGRLTRESDPLALPRWPVSYAVSMETFQGYFADFFPALAGSTPAAGKP